MSISYNGSLFSTKNEIQKIIQSEKVPTTYSDVYKKIISDLSNCLVSQKNYEKFSELYFDVYRKYEYRHMYTKNFSWSIPTLEALLMIKEECQNIIELYSGTGYWAHLLAKIGCEIKCFDDFTWEEYNIEEKFGEYFEVNNINNYSLSTFEGCNLMIGWPPYKDEECTKYLKQIKPSKLIYIGETDGGCCGSDSFFDEIYHKYDEIKSMGLPQWLGLHDWLVIYKRKNNL